MNRVLEALRAALATMVRLITKTISVTKIIGGRVVRSTETVVERAVDVGQAVGQLAVGAVGDVVKAPLRIAGGVARAVGGARPAQQTLPQDEAAEARDAAVTQQRRADAAEDARAVLLAFRRVAQARASGVPADPAHLGRLPRLLVDYLDALTADELDALARKPTSELRRVITGGDRDVRSASEALAGPAPTGVPAVVDIRDARRATLREAVRGVRAEREPTADDVLAAAHAA